MAKNTRVGQIKNRSQFLNFLTNLWQKRDSKSGRIKDVKTTGGKFKGVRKEKLKRSGKSSKI